MGSLEISMRFIRLIKFAGRTGMILQNRNFVGAQYLQRCIVANKVSTVNLATRRPRDSCRAEHRRNRET